MYSDHVCIVQFKISNPFIVHRIPGVRPVKNLKQCVLHVNILYSLYNCTVYSVQYPWDQLNVYLVYSVLLFRLI